MDDLSISGVLKWLLEVSLWVFIGSFAGRFVELMGWMNFASFIGRPVVKLGRLPPVGGVAFLSAFASGPAAQSMLAAAYRDGTIGRFQMYCCAVACSFPNKLSHMMRPFYRIVALLGLVACAYVGIQTLIDILMAICALMLCRTLSKPSASSAPAVEAPEKTKAPGWKEAARKSLKSSARTLLRVMLIAAPAYVLVLWLSKHGFFAKAESMLPAAAREVFSKDVMKIMLAKMGGLVGSAAVAAKLMKSGSVSQWQALLALVAANMLSIPFSTLRRNIPVSLGIFPGLWGLWIVLTSQGFRILLNMLVLLLLVWAGAK